MKLLQNVSLRRHVDANHGHKSMQNVAEQSMLFWFYSRYAEQVDHIECVQEEHAGFRRAPDPKQELECEEGDAAAGGDGWIACAREWRVCARDVMANKGGKRRQNAFHTMQCTERMRRRNATASALHTAVN